MKKLVIEYHYQDGDIGAYEAGKEALRLWEGFANINLDPLHVEPKCIIIRRASENES